MKVLSQLFVVLFFITGCASGPKFEQLTELQTGEAGIYLYRPATLVNALVSPDVYFNGQVTSTLQNGGYVFIKANAGSHLLTLTSEIYMNWPFSPLQIPIELKEGQTLFFEMRSSFAIKEYYVVKAKLQNGVSISQVPALQAIQKLKQLNQTALRTKPTEKTFDPSKRRKKPYQ